MQNSISIFLIFISVFIISISAGINQNLVNAGLAAQVNEYFEYDLDNFFDSSQDSLTVTSTLPKWLTLVENTNVIKGTATLYPFTIGTISISIEATDGDITFNLVVKYSNLLMQSLLYYCGYFGIFAWILLSIKKMRSNDIKNFRKLLKTKMKIVATIENQIDLNYIQDDISKYLIHKTPELAKAAEVTAIQYVTHFLRIFYSQRIKKNFNDYVNVWPIISNLLHKFEEYEESTHYEIGAGYNTIFTISSILELLLHQELIHGNTVEVSFISNRRKMLKWIIKCIKLQAKSDTKDLDVLNGLYQCKEALILLGITTENDLTHTIINLLLCIIIPFWGIKKSYGSTTIKLSKPKNWYNDLLYYKELSKSCYFIKLFDQKKLQEIINAIEKYKDWRYQYSMLMIIKDIGIAYKRLNKMNELQLIINKLDELEHNMSIFKKHSKEIKMKIKQVKNDINNESSNINLYQNYPGLYDKNIIFIIDKSYKKVLKNKVKKIVIYLMN